MLIMLLNKNPNTYAKHSFEFSSTCYFCENCYFVILVEGGSRNKVADMEFEEAGRPLVNSQYEKDVGKRDESLNVSFSVVHPFL